MAALCKAKLLDIAFSFSFHNTSFECQIRKKVNILDRKVLPKNYVVQILLLHFPRLIRWHWKKVISHLLLQFMADIKWKALYAIIITKDFPKIRKMIYKGEDIRNGGQFFRRYEPDMHLPMLHIFNIPEENSFRNIPQMHHSAVPCTVK